MASPAIRASNRKLEPRVPSAPVSALSPAAGKHPQHVGDPVGVPEPEVAEAGDRELCLFERDLVLFGDESLEPTSSRTFVPLRILGGHQDAEVDRVKQAQPAGLPCCGLGLHEAADLEGALEAATW